MIFSQNPLFSGDIEDEDEEMTADKEEEDMTAYKEEEESTADKESVADAVKRRRSSVSHGTSDDSNMSYAAEAPAVKDPTPEATSSEMVDSKHMLIRIY